MPAITPNQLIDAERDARDLEKVINGGAFDPNILTRKGKSLPTLARMLNSAGPVPSGVLELIVSEQLPGAIEGGVSGIVGDALTDQLPGRLATALEGDEFNETLTTIVTPLLANVADIDLENVVLTRPDMEAVQVPVTALLNDLGRVPSQFGAAGNGTVDDSAALQALFDAASVGGGDRLRLVDTYYINSTVTVKKHLTLDGLSAEGLLLADLPETGSTPQSYRDRKGTIVFGPSGHIVAKEGATFDGVNLIHVDASTPFTSAGEAYTLINAGSTSYQGNGSQKAFTLPYNPRGDTNVQVMVDGVLVPRVAGPATNWTLSGTTVTLGTAPGVGATTLNPAKKSANLTLSGGNLTSTAAGLGNTRSARPQWYGHYAFEVTVTAGGEDGTRIGLVHNDCPVDDRLGQAHAGGGYMSVGILTSGAVYMNGAPIGTGPAFTDGDTVLVEVDLEDRMLYWRVKTGTTVGPLSVGVKFEELQGPLYAAISQRGPSSDPVLAASVATVNFGATAFAMTPTLGTSAWRNNVDLRILGWESNNFAVGVDGPDVTVTNCVIIGFSASVSFLRTQRTNIFENKIDCYNGIVFERTIDTCRIYNNGFWPFSTAIRFNSDGSAWSQICLIRKGIGIKCGTLDYAESAGNRNDGPLIFGNLVFGWDVCAEIANSYAVQFSNNWLDNTTFDWRARGTTGLRTRGTVRLCKISNNHVDAHWHHYHLNHGEPTIVGAASGLDFLHNTSGVCGRTKIMCGPGNGSIVGFHSSAATTNLTSVSNGAGKWVVIDSSGGAVNRGTLYDTKAEADAWIAASGNTMWSHISFANDADLAHQAANPGCGYWVVDHITVTDATPTIPVFSCPANFRHKIEMGDYLRSLYGPPALAPMKKIDVRAFKPLIETVQVGAVAQAAGTFGRLPFNSELADGHEEWNASSLQYTAVTDGYRDVHINLAALLGGGTATLAAAELYKNGVKVRRILHDGAAQGAEPDGALYIQPLSFTVYLEAGDTAWVQFYYANRIVTYDTGNMHQTWKRARV